MLYAASNKPQEETVIATGITSTGRPVKKFRQKVCRFCGEVFEPKAPSHFYCCQDCAECGWSEGYIKRSYGMTFEQWVCMYEKAGGSCQICGSRGFKMNPNHQMTLLVDHDHSTGEVRGMLCHNCNRALGLFHDSIDDLKQAVSYLERSNDQREIS